MGTQARKQGPAGQEAAPRVRLGIERVYEPQAQSLLEGKRLGLFTNQTGVDSKLRSSVDILRDRYVVSALFVPEHGLFGAVEAGKKFSSSEYKGSRVLSL